MGHNIEDIWDIMKTVIYIGAVAVIIFVTVVKWGQTAPKKIDGIKTQVESLETSTSH